MELGWERREGPLRYAPLPSLSPFLVAGQSSRVSGGLGPEKGSFSRGSPVVWGRAGARVWVSSGALKEGGGREGRHLRGCGPIPPPSGWQNGPLLFCSCPGGLGFRPAPSSSSQRPGSISLGFWHICFAGGQQEDSPPIIKRLGDSPHWSLSRSQEARGGSWQEGRSPFSRGTWGPAGSSRLAPGLASPLGPACPFGNHCGLRQGHTQTSSISSG